MKFTDEQKLEKAEQKTAFFFGQTKVSNKNEIFF